MRPFGHLLSHFVEFFCGHAPQPPSTKNGFLYHISLHTQAGAAFEVDADRFLKDSPYETVSNLCMHVAYKHLDTRLSVVLHQLYR